VTIFLVYHEVGDERVARGVEPGDLDRHLRMIRATGALIADPARLDGLECAGPRFVFCFDDGTANHASVAAPVLEKHGVKAIFYVPTQKLGRPDRLTADGMNHLHRSGHTIGVHGHTHDRWDRLSLNALRDELQTSGAIIRDVCGVDAVHAAPPGGFFTPAVVEVARSLDLTFFRTMRWGFNRRSDRSAIEVLPMTRRFGDWFIRAALTGRRSRLVEAAYACKCLVRGQSIPRYQEEHRTRVCSQAAETSNPAARERRVQARHAGAPADRHAGPPPR
jgi:peptidoglycan/xylan/chitin deacetylase (PgdA/CDA1 family)